jgi:uncharacterized alpha-E superfamily protein
MNDHRETMLSRVADNLYWMSRYLERAEHTARLIDVDLQLGLDQSPDASSRRWLGLLEALQVPAPDAILLDAESLTNLLTLDRANPSSIISCVAAARENLRQVREQCGPEMWEQLNRLFLHVKSNASSDVGLRDSYAFFRAVQEGSHLFQGVTDSTMSHGEGWHYIQLGRFVERTEAVARLIASHFTRLPHPLDQAVESEEYLEWVALLKSCAAFQAYCKAHTAELRPLRVAEFLLLNPSFPHSIAFSVNRIHAALTAIADLTERKAEQPVRISGRLLATLNFSQIEEIIASGAIAYVDSIRWQCSQIHTAIQQVYFDYSVETDLVA